MDLAEGLISFLVKRCLERRRSDLQTIGRDVTKLEKIEAPFPRITYDEAVEDAAGRRTPKARWKTSSSGAAIWARRMRPTFRRSSTSR